MSDSRPSELNLWTRQWRDERIRKARADFRERDAAFQCLKDKSTDYAKSIKMACDVCAQVLAVWESSPVDLPDTAALAAAPMPPPVEAREPIPPKIAAIIEHLHTQNNRITSHPLFAVQQKRNVYGLDEDYASDHRWVNRDGECSQEDARLYEAKRKNGQPLPDGVRRLGLVENWEFVTGCMTEQGCKDFIACNGHNLNEPRIYAYSGYRNAEFIALREWLMSLRSAATHPKEPTEARGDGGVEACPDCGQAMDKHDFGVPKPPCPAGVQGMEDQQR